MASFSQLRLAQISGSFGTSAGQMNDLLGPYAKAAHSGSEAGLSLADHLSHVVSAVKRIHGASEFSTAATGSFTTSIFPATSDGAALGAKDKEWSDLYLADGAVISLGDDDDTTLTHTDGSGIAINSTNKIGFGGNFNAYINHDGTDLQLVDDADINIKPAVDFLVDAGGDIILDADGGDVTFKDGGTSRLIVDMDAVSGEVMITNGTDGDDIKFSLDAGSTEIMRLDDSASSLLMASTKKIEFGSADAFIHHDGTDLQITDNADIDLSAGAEIRLDAPTAVLMEKSGTTFLKFNSGSESGTAEISAPNSTYADIVFKGNSAGEVFRLDDSADSILLNSTSKLQLGGTASSLSGDGTDATLTSTGNVNVVSTVNEAQAIYLRANAGTSETIKIHSDQGTGVASILVDSDVGGVKLNAGLDGNAAAIHLDSASGITIAGGDVNDSVYFENSPISLEALAAGGEPSSTTGKLYNVTGSLVWAGKVITPRAQKLSYSVTASHAATDDLVIAGLSHDRGVNALTSDIYLNGQLMLSGASSTTGDYKLSGTVTNVRFHFGLEADDVVTVITMG